MKRPKAKENGFESRVFFRSSQKKLHFQAHRLAQKKAFVFAIPQVAKIVGELGDVSIGLVDYPSF